MSAVIPEATVADTREIALVLGLTKRAVERRAAREAWPYREQNVRGGKRRLYSVNTLPEHVQAALLRRASLLKHDAESLAILVREYRRVEGRYNTEISEIVFKIAEFCRRSPKSAKTLEAHLRRLV